MYARVAAFEQPDVSVVDGLIDTVRANELRRQSAEATGETITSVERYEVALSEQLTVR